MDFDTRCDLLIPVEDLFKEAEAVILPDFYARLCKSGCEIYQKKIKTNFGTDTFVRICDKNGFFALGQVKDYPKGSAIKAIKLFVI